MFQLMFTIIYFHVNLCTSNNAIIRALHFLTYGILCSIIDHIVSWVAKGSNYICKWLGIKPFWLSTNGIAQRDIFSVVSVTFVNLIWSAAQHPQCPVVVKDMFSWLTTQTQGVSQDCVPGHRMLHSGSAKIPRLEQYYVSAENWLLHSDGTSVHFHGFCSR